jgi:hypothetical protein
MPPQSKRSLFREHAFQAYIQRRERDILPRVISPSMFVFLWVCLGIILAVVGMSWWAKVPTFARGSGVVVTSTKQAAGTNETVALVYFPAEYRSHLNAGMSSKVELATGQSTSTASIIQQRMDMLTPERVQQTYNLSCSPALTTLITTQPSVPVEMKLNVRSYVSPGTPVQALVQTGSQRVLQLLPLPGVQQLGGG